MKPKSAQREGCPARDRQITCACCVPPEPCPYGSQFTNQGDCGQMVESEQLTGRSAEGFLTRSELYVPSAFIGRASLVVFPLQRGLAIFRPS